MTRANQPLLAELTEQQRHAVLLGADALKGLKEFARKSFDEWMLVAKGVALLCAIADRPGMSRKARKNLLNDNGYGTLNESTVSRLRLMAEHETAIRVWRGSLTENKRESWNSPTSICNRCPAVRKAIGEANKHKPPRRPRQKDAMAEIEKALDVIGDLAYGLKDADQRAVISERLLAFAKQFGKPAADVDDDDKDGPATEPKAVASKRAGKTKAACSRQAGGPGVRLGSLTS